MDLHPDFKDLLAELVRANVRFAIIGGYAVGHHAKARATKDLDVLVSGTPENLTRVAKALETFGAPPNVVVDLARHMSIDEVVYLGVEPVRIDILRSADGIDTEAVLGRTVTLTIGAFERARHRSRRPHRERARFRATSRRRGRRTARTGRETEMSYARPTLSSMPARTS